MCEKNRCFKEKKGNMMNLESVCSKNIKNIIKNIKNCEEKLARVIQIVV